MNKYFLIILLLLLAGTVWAQKKKASPVYIIKSESADGSKKDGKELLKVYKAVFQQDNTILSSDSAYFYTSENAVDAFGHVIITQGDTLHVFGDKLNYQGNTKIAIMTDNVRLIDKDAILTTNYFTYSTATKYGTYTGGGKLVSKDNTLTSKNGYYFASTRDAYFRYDVVLNTPDAIIKTDTLRYNSGSRIAFFLGPTNIYGKKDKDTLYTENGSYNTQTEQAFFGKKNLYKQGTKSLKGDSLFYDRIVGYGKAVKNVVFKDSEQKIAMYGGLGENFKKGERTMMTDHPYVVFVTEEKDTTKQSKKDSLKLDSIAAKAKTGIVAKPGIAPPKNSMPVIDPTQIKMAKDMATVALNQVPQSQKDSVANQVKSALVNKPAILPPKNSIPVIYKPKKKADKKAMANVAPVLKPDSLGKKDAGRIKRDSIFFSGDTIETRIVTYKELKDLKEVRRLEGIHDTTNRPSIVYTKPVKHLDIAPLRMRSDTTIFHKDYFNKRPAKQDTSKSKLPVVSAPKKAKPAVKKYMGIDSVNISQEVILSDTARVRILSAAHHAKIFKSDLQAKADSIFFSYSDSVARMYVHPMIWVQGSQLSADTINLQMKHKQLDNMELMPSAMVVNIERSDTAHFNQVGGRKMRGFFKDSKLAKMFVYGNAETIYFDRDSGKVTRMHRTITSKIRVNFKNNEPQSFTEYVKADARIIPISKIKDDDKLLKNFIWKPQDRPVSKEDVIGSGKSKVQTGKQPVKAPPKKLPAKTGEKKAIIPSVKLPADSALKSKPDTLSLEQDRIKRLKLKTDTTKTKP
ncbi:MAG: OstA-like protein [Mucilaginibacter sp.]|uniref:OstA-like protein n=1 Tax=Mucilaginibacter sp. TaxID=1882438 RepID=UPI0032677E32